MMAESFAGEADFFSIGTNDLTQYTLAMDRGHPKLAPKVDALNPGCAAPDRHDGRRRPRARQVVGRLRRHRRRSASRAHAGRSRRGRTEREPAVDPRRSRPRCAALPARDARSSRNALSTAAPATKCVRCSPEA